MCLVDLWIWRQLPTREQRAARVHRIAAFRKSVFQLIENVERDQSLCTRSVKPSPRATTQHKNEIDISRGSTPCVTVFNLRWKPRKIWYPRTFHNDDCWVVKPLENLVECPLVMPCDLVVALKLLFFWRKRNVRQVWVLKNKIQPSFKVGLENIDDGNFRYPSGLALQRKIKLQRRECSNVMKTDEICERRLKLWKL